MKASTYRLDKGDDIRIDEARYEVVGRGKGTVKLCDENGEPVEMPRAQLQQLAAQNRVAWVLHIA